MLEHIGIALSGAGAVIAGVAAWIGAKNHSTSTEIHHSLNGHPTDESLGWMIYDLRERVARHHSLPADEAHPGKN